MSRGTVPTFADPATQLRAIAGAIDKAPYQIRIEVGAEAANVRKFSFQVVNRQRAAIPGRYLVRVWFSTGLYAAPAAGLTLAVATGTLERTLTANQELEIITNTAGLVEVNATIVGAATYYAHALGPWPIEASAAAAWV